MWMVQSLLNDSDFCLQIIAIYTIKAAKLYAALAYVDY